MPSIALTMRTSKDTKELVVKLDVGEDVRRWSAGAPGGLLSRKAAEGAKQSLPPGGRKEYCSIRGALCSSPPEQAGQKGKSLLATRLVQRAGGTVP